MIGFVVVIMSGFSSVLVSSLSFSVTRNVRTGIPFSRRYAAAPIPSPPLLPGPQKMATLPFGGINSIATFASCSAAVVMSVVPDMPRFSMT